MPYLQLEYTIRLLEFESQAVRKDVDNTRLYCHFFKNCFFFKKVSVKKDYEAYKIDLCFIYSKVMTGFVTAFSACLSTG